METEKLQILKDEFDEEELQQFGSAPEAVQNDIMTRIDKINNMGEMELVRKLKCFRLDTQGSKDDLKSRLKNSYKKISLATIDLSVSKNLLPYYVVIDFEATCEGVSSPNFRHEIIEFPAVIVNSRKQEIVDCFHMFVKPSINPILSEFCKELTGITQEQIDSAECFEKVFHSFQNWLAKNNLGKKHKFAIVTDGPWDMSRFLFSQCHYSNVEFPKWGLKWVNIKNTFSKFYKCERICLKNMLEYLNMEFEGRLHSGLDDAKNIARILLRMIYDGANLQVNEGITKIKKLTVKIKSDDNEIVNNDLVSENKLEKIRVEAQFRAICYVNKMPLYKEIKRERLIAETQLARKILNNNRTGKCNSGNKAEHRRKKKILLT